jgi:multidrug efflux system outer membrane protein
MPTKLVFWIFLEMVFGVIWKTVFLIFVSGLVGCAQTPDFERPPMPVPKQWVGSSGDARQFKQKTHWRTFFSDPQLLALIGVALENNRDLRIAAARVQEARAQYGIARADLGPTINLLGTGSITRSPAEVLNSGDSTNSQRFDLSLSTVSFEFDFWGRVASLSEAARLSYLSTEESRRSVYLSLVADVASAYFTLLQMQDQSVLERSTLGLREQSLALIAKGKALGGANDFEFQQSISLLEATRANLANLEYQQNVALNRLNFLLGNTPFAWQPGAGLNQQGLDADVSPGLPAEVLLSRPDVIAAEHRLMAAHANIKAARAAFLPKILLTASMGVASQGLASLFSGGAWVFQPLISLPLFDGGRTAAGVDLALARKVVAVAEYERAIQIAFREVADLLSSGTALATQISASKAALQAQARRLEIAQGRFDAGMSSYLEVLDAQRDLNLAQQQATQLRRVQLETSVQLYKALGGGDELVKS